MFENPYAYFAALIFLALAGYFLPKRPFLVGGILVVVLLVVGFVFLSLQTRTMSVESNQKTSPGRAPASLPAPTVLPSPPKLTSLPNTLQEFSTANPGASVAYTAPTKMDMGQDANVTAVLSIQQSVDALKAILKKQTVEEIQVDGAKVDVATRMIATLSGFGFTISPSGQQEQPVLINKPTTWSWQVKADQEGLRTLNMKIEAVIGVDGQNLRREIEVKNWKIDVAVGPWEKAQQFAGEVADFLADLKEIWLGLAFFGSLVISRARGRSTT